MYILANSMISVTIIRAAVKTGREVAECLCLELFVTGGINP